MGWWHAKTDAELRVVEYPEPDDHTYMYEYEEDAVPPGELLAISI